MIDVVGAYISKNGRFMICQRPKHKGSGLKWEFVGGKVEQGEDKREALVRECREELGIEVEPGEVFAETEYQYPDIHIRLTVFCTRIVSGTPQLYEHCDLRWVLPEEAVCYDFSPADIPVVNKILGV